MSRSGRTCINSLAASWEMREPFKRTNSGMYSQAQSPASHTSELLAAARANRSTSSSENPAKCETSGRTSASAPRYELAVLAQHYLEEASRIAFECWVFAQVGSTDWRFRSFAGRRLESICQCLSDDEFHAVVDTIEEQWQKKFADAEENGEFCDGCGCLHDLRIAPLCQERGAENSGVDSVAGGGMN